MDTLLLLFLYSNGIASVVAFCTTIAKETLKNHGHPSVNRGIYLARAVVMGVMWLVFLDY